MATTPFPVNSEKLSRSFFAQMQLAESSLPSTDGNTPFAGVR